MRFNFAQLLVAVSVATVAARPTIDHSIAAREVVASHEIQERSLITSLTPLVAKALETLGLPKILGSVNNILEGAVKQTLDDLGLTFTLNRLAVLPGPRPKQGDVQAIGRAVTQLLQGLNIDEVNRNLNRATKGAIDNLSRALGLDDVLASLGITGILGATNP